MPFYAVAKGRKKGIYHSWSECAPQVNGYSGAIYKKFQTVADAKAFINAHCAAPKYVNSTKINLQGTSKNNLKIIKKNNMCVTCGRPYPTRGESAGEARGRAAASAPALTRSEHVPNNPNIICNASCIDSMARLEAVFAAEVKKLQADKLKLQEQLTLVGALRARPSCRGWGFQTTTEQR